MTQKVVNQFTFRCPIFFWSNVSSPWAWPRTPL